MSSIKSGRPLHEDREVPGEAAATESSTDDEWQGFDIDSCYDMSNNPGICLIINNDKFEAKTKQKPRPGSDEDADRLEKVFTKLGFRSVVQHNLTAERMREEIKNAAKGVGSDDGCFVLAILSHGSIQGYIFGTDAPITMEVLLDPLKGAQCQALKGKPKLIIVQACRGDKLDPGADPGDSTEAAASKSDEDHLTPEQKLLQQHEIRGIEADFLCSFATPAGYFAFRQKDGSPFIKRLCDVLGEMQSSQEIMNLLTEVNSRLAAEFKAKCKKNAPEKHGKVQVPSISSQLTKRLYLAPLKAECK